MSIQHNPDIKLDKLRQRVKKEVITRVINSFGFDDDNYELYINPTGKFVIGGPLGDIGLTGRKIIVDSYGGSAPHDRGAFFGKDPTKVDRSAAYYARYVASNIVSANLASKALI